MKVSIEPDARKFIQTRGNQIYLTYKKFYWTAAWGATSTGSYLPAVSVSKPEETTELLPLEVDGIEVFYEPVIPNPELTVILQIQDLKQTLAIKENGALNMR